MIYQQIEAWGFERKEIQNILTTYQNLEHIQDKINFVRAKSKKGTIDNVKIYFLSLLRKEQNIISTESIEILNKKKHDVKNQEALKSRNALIEMQQKKQVTLREIDTLKESVVQQKREKVAEFFEKFPDLKIKICEEVAQINQFWQFFGKNQMEILN